MPDSFYSDASVYDILHAPGTAAEVTGLERIERRFLGEQRGGRGGRGGWGVWLEPACGTARYLRVAARRGRRVVGFDASETMIAYARARFERLGAEVARRAILFVADMEGFDRAVASPFRAMRQTGGVLSGGDVRTSGIGRKPGATFAFNLINTFRHLETDEAAVAHLRAIRRVLSDGGIYALGISMSGYGKEFPSEDVWEARRGSVHVRQVAQYDPPMSRRRRWEQVHNVVIIQRPGREDEVQTSSYRLRTYDRRQLEAIIAKAGFKVAGHVDEQGHDVPVTEPGYGIWILRA
jgi:SAM-dependent methyltransferase